MRSLDIAGTGMQAQQTNVEVISNNIANMTTTGFKRRRAEFQDLIYQNLRRRRIELVRTAARSCRPGPRSGSASRPPPSTASASRAISQQTGEHVSMSRCSGNGYFQVTLPSGEHRLYPRRHVRRCRPTAPSSPPTATRWCSPASPCPNNADQRHHRRLRSGAGDHKRGRPNAAPRSATIQLAAFPNEAGLEAHRRQPLRAECRERQRR